MRSYKVYVLMFLCILSRVTYATATSSIPQYTVTDLGTLTNNYTSRAVDINNHGHITGTESTLGSWYGFLWQDGVKTILPDITPVAINDHGQIAGGIGNSACLWNGGTLYNLGTSIGYTQSINDSQQIVGLTLNPTSAALWESDSWSDTTILLDGHFSEAEDINNLGQIVGYSHQFADDEYVFHGLLWQDNQMIDLGGGIGPYAINDLGQIVGGTHFNNEYNISNDNAFLLDRGEIFDLGPGDAIDINNNGVVIGNNFPTPSNPYPYSAFLWQNGQRYDLNDLIPGDSPWLLQSASAINDLNQIVGLGTFNGSIHAFILNPIPEPATSVLLAMGSIFLIRKTLYINWRLL